MTRKWAARLWDPGLGPAHPCGDLGVQRAGARPWGPCGGTALAREWAARLRTLWPQPVTLARRLHVRGACTPRGLPVGTPCLCRVHLRPTFRIPRYCVLFGLEVRASG